VLVFAIARGPYFLTSMNDLIILFIYRLRWRFSTDKISISAQEYAIDEIFPDSSQLKSPKKRRLNSGTSNAVQ
jgi:hypothetical protein